jgi:chromosomal replication initiation ATPase DnaA
VSSAEDLLPKTETPIGRSQEALDAVVERVCSHFDVTPRDLASSRRGEVLPRARAAISFLAVAQLGLPGSQVAKSIGISRSTVSRAIGPGAEICATEHLE